MALPVMEFQDQGYKIRKLFAYKSTYPKEHCRKKIGDVQIVSEQVLIICRSLGIRNAQFVGY
jgi:hypothetical protein